MEKHWAEKLALKALIPTLLLIRCVVLDKESDFSGSQFPQHSLFLMSSLFQLLQDGEGEKGIIIDINISIHQGSLKGL